MSGYVVVIGNFQRVYTGFESREDAQKWADVAEYTGLTDNGRSGVTIVAESPRAKHWGFKVPVDVWAGDEVDDAFTEEFVVLADSFDEAEEKAVARAVEKYPGQHCIAHDAKVRM